MLQTYIFPMETRAHWDNTYTTKSDTQVSWYQPVPERSLALITSAAPDPSAAIIDVGGGASRLVDALLAEYYADITVLDVSEVALGRSRERLGDAAEKITWITADITRWQPQRTWDVLHDRAVFHFLTDKTAQDAYVAALMAATKAGSTIIIATFALDGPERCSGLPVQRYSAETLAARLGPDFSLYAASKETHPTPFGTTQQFSYAAFRRRS
ncbi:trans-aconitate 2-methyltransferase [Taklimakanibacter deserti]|uniref:trans-aconitate 2-methyltransferase n=1 Tax=Taklimakanibacter deserti TaxID=2267839 RepID=UPI0034D53801